MGGDCVGTYSKQKTRRRSCAPCATDKSNGVYAKRLYAGRPKRAGMLGMCRLLDGPFPDPEYHPMRGMFLPILLEILHFHRKMA